MIPATSDQNAAATPSGANPRVSLRPPKDGLLSRLVRVLSSLELPLDEASIPRAVCEAAIELFDARLAAVWLVDESTNQAVGNLGVDCCGSVSIPEDISLDAIRHPIVGALSRSTVELIERSVSISFKGASADQVDALLVIPLRAGAAAPAVGALAVGGFSRIGIAAEEIRDIGSLLGRTVAERVQQQPADPRMHVPSGGSDRSLPLLDVLTDGVVLISAGGVVLHVSSVAAELLGVRAEELSGRTARDVDWPFLDEVGRRIAFEGLPLALALRDRKGTHERELQAGPPSQQRMVCLTARFLESSSAREGQVAVVIRDLTEHRKLVEQLSRTERMRIVGQLASAAIHDINNWFGLILGQSELILVADPPSEVVEGLESIRQAALDGAEALKRIQDLARPSADIDPTPVDVNQLLREVVDITRSKWSQVLPSGASTSVIMDLSIPLAPISVVPSEVREVFTNLVLNAVDAMPQGGTLRVVSKRRRNRIVVTIADTGTGMSEDVRARIFEPFFTTKGVRGSGLGLAVSKTMVDRYGGRISVESELGHGTTFTLSFAPSETAKNNSGSPDVPAPRPSRVLLVEDDQQMREMLTRMLELDRHTVSACRSGRDAITLLGTDTFDIVITDLMMPLADGWDVAQATRKAQPMVPVVLITGTNQRFSQAELRARGVSARLNKPFRLEQLQRTINNLVSSAEPEHISDDRPRILAVDDEPAMTRMIAAMLLTSGCEVQTATDGADARLLLEEASRAGRPFGLLFTDMQMPGINGGELIREAREINPYIVTVLLSGNADDGIAVGADLSLQKPYSLAALLSALDQAVALSKRVARR